MSKRNIGLTITLVLLVSQAAANSDYVWLSSEQSYIVNRSTVALAKGRLDRAVYYARVALHDEHRASDQLIAHHNLCVAYLNLNIGNRAQPHCDAALSLATSRLKVTYRRGAYYIVADEHTREQQLTNVASMILANISQSTDNARFACTPDFNPDSESGVETEHLALGVSR